MVGSLLASFAFLCTPTARGVLPRTDTQEQALRLLVHAFDATSPKNIEAIMHMPIEGSNGFQTVRVLISRDGKQKLTVLQPLDRAGLVILDIGDTREVYDPDKGELTVGQSPAASLFDPAQRLQLVRSNYRVSMSRGVKVAGQIAVRIDAQSKHPQVGALDIFVDPASYFVYEVDHVDAKGRRTVRYDTKAVAFPDSIDPAAFTITGHVTTRHQASPIPVRDLAEARMKAGFAPVVPTRLPNGFIVRRTYVRLDPEYKAIGLELSDGLASATVFQFPRKGAPESLRKAIKGGDVTYFERSGVIVAIFSELPATLREKLLTAFRPGR